MLHLRLRPSALLRPGWHASRVSAGSRAAPLPGRTRSQAELFRLEGGQGEESSSEEESGSDGEDSGEEQEGFGGSGAAARARKPKPGEPRHCLVSAATRQELEGWQRRRISLNQAKATYGLYKWDVEKLPHE